MSKACDQCRTKKAKCDANLPSCSMCIGYGEKCTYTRESKKRGVPTGLISNLEQQVQLFKALCGEMMQTIPECRRFLENRLDKKSAIHEQVSATYVEKFSEIWQTSSVAVHFAETQQLLKTVPSKTLPTLKAEDNTESLRGKFSFFFLFFLLSFEAT